MVRAVVLVDTEPRRTEKIFDSIKGLKEVTAAMQVYGEYDMVFIVQSINTVGIQNFVKSLRQKHGVLRTVTLIELAV